MAPANEMTRFICLFHSSDRARAAVSALEEAGVARDAVSILGDNTGSAAYRGSEELNEMGVPERDLTHLQDGLRRGGVVVSVQALESKSDAIERTFHRYSADKIDETAVQKAEPGLATAGAHGAGAPVVREAVVGEAVVGEAVIPVAAEELLVGKREVDRGGVRVYRRTVEEPVQQDVNLHSDRVVLEYREVDRPVTDADLRAGNREIELVETAEVPVVEKVARVVEEVRVGKVETDRTEVVKDTVRHTEVEVEPIEATDARETANSDTTQGYGGSAR